MEPADSPPNSPPQSGRSPDQAAEHPSESPPPSVDWEVIARGCRLVSIRFQGQTYQLRETRNGKLILTK